MAAYVEYGRTAAAGRGWDWIAQGWSLFRKQPGIWIAMIVVLAALVLVLPRIPGGVLLLLFLTPALAASLAIASRKLDQGEKLGFSVLLAGFRERFGALAAVGAAYAVTAVVLVIGIGKLLGIGMLWPIALRALLLQAQPGSPEALGALLAYLVALLLLLALMIPVFMAIWFAPPLIVFHGKGALRAVRESFVACLRNVVPFLVYGVAMLVLAVLATMPLLLGWLVLGPVSAASIYTAYKDIFTAA